MPTKQPRINVVLNRETRDALTALAKHRDMSHSAVAAELIAEALNEQEDHYWSDVAKERRKDKVSSLSHQDVWKDFPRKRK